MQRVRLQSLTEYICLNLQIMDIVARLRRYMDRNGIPVSVLADTAQISRPTLSQILSGRNKKVSNEVISKLHAAYPDLNIMWLLFGDGDMESGENIETSSRQNGLFETSFDSEPVGFESDMTVKPEKTPLPNSDQTRDSDPSLGEIGTEGYGFERNRQSFAPSSSRNRTATPSVAPRNEQPSEVHSPGISFLPDSTKKVQQIMVFYSDNSFEIFTPAGK